MPTFPANPLPKCRRSVPAFALATLALLTAVVPAAEQPKYFSIRMNDNLIGYAVVDRETARRDGQDLLRLKSETWLKVAMLGKQRSTLLDSETLIDSSTGQPLSYRLTSKTNDVVQHVECEFVDGAARTWIYHEGDPRGEPVETKLPEGAVILGSNNFAHWQRLLAAAKQWVADDKVAVPVFLPDVAQVETFDFVRKEPRDVPVAGKTRNCAVWRFETADLNAFADAKTDEFVRLDLPAQQTTIELADAEIVKLAQKARAEEVLARHFAQSNVVFDDFLKVSTMQAEIDVKVIGTGVANEASVLTTAMQNFEGSKEADHIVGKVTIRSVSYDGGQSPAFPTAPNVPDLDEWLKPTAYIECDHPSIVAKAAELTKGATTRWEAVQRIGGWVHQEIAYTIADTPSARLALEKKQGDCGPHSTLMVALLQSVGIPARLVGGLVYTPTFGGSFGQHAWVEVHMGKTGWLAVDPTTGEFERMSATHIKLFEGLGGVIPESAKVAAFEPPNRQQSVAATAAPKPLPWKFGKQYTFNYKQGDKELGSETFTIAKVKPDGEEAYELKSDVKLEINRLTSLSSSATMVVAPHVQPISFHRELGALLQKVKIECSFKEGVVKQEVSGTTSLSREIKLPAGAYCFDNNLMGCWVLIGSQLSLEPDKPVGVVTYHPSSLQVINLTFTPKAPAPITIGGKEVVCYECDVAPIRNTFWISKDGRFVRAKQGDLVIELAEIE